MRIDNNKNASFSYVISSRERKWHELLWGRAFSFCELLIDFLVKVPFQDYAILILRPYISETFPWLSQEKVFGRCPRQCSECVHVSIL